MFRGVLGVVFVALVLIGGVPAAAQSPTAPRVWTQLDGVVEQVEATRLTLKTDQGARVRVDISAMSAVDRKELNRGRRVSLIGYTAAKTGEFMAWFAPVDEATLQASPATTSPAPAPPATTAPAKPAPTPPPAR